MSKWAVPLARDYWEAMSTPPYRIRPTHDVYLRLWAQSHPKLKHDVVMLDESQDADPLIAGVVSEQLDHAQVIIVGDSAQAIYGWRGAVDFLDGFPATHRLALTQSFRFGPDIAARANRWLGTLRADMRISGTPARKPATGAPACLCRSNAGVVAEVIAAQTQADVVHIVGEGVDIRRFAVGALELQSAGWTSHPTLSAFGSWDAVVAHAATDEGGDLAMLVRVVERYGASTITRAIDQCVSAERSHDVVVSTAHKAKGLEWPSVRIAGDFRAPGRDEETGKLLPVDPAEAMLAYVAVTRAQTSLNDSALDWLDEYLEVEPVEEPEPVVANLDPSRPDTPAYTPGQRHVAHVLAMPHVCAYEPEPEPIGVAL